MNARRRWPGAVLVLTVALTLGLAEMLAGAGTAQAASWAPSAARPFSDPTWYPLRTTAKVSCTYLNCPGPVHGYQALDLLGQRGDPVFAAGAGIVHIGAVDSSCKTASAPDAPGTWVWIDHGGGVVSRYHHLDSLTVREGQLVTPATQIGRMGHSGDYAPCTSNYLHFEVRQGGVKGPRVDPGQLWGCQAGVRRAFPAAIGYASWNDVPRQRRWIPPLDNSCMPSSTATPTPPGSISVRRGDGSARISWTPPTAGAASVDRILISQELWAPSVRRWHAPTYRTKPATQRVTTVTGLDNGRRYRFRVLARNAVGNSAWTPYVEVVPATVPTVPATDRGLSATRDSLRFAWYKSAAQGTPVRAYTLAIRRKGATGWKAWHYVTVPAGTLSYRFTGLRAGATYQVTVRADSSTGSSRYGAPRTITTAR